MATAPLKVVPNLLHPLLACFSSLEIHFRGCCVMVEVTGLFVGVSHGGRRVFFEVSKDGRLSLEISSHRPKLLALYFNEN